MTDLSGLAKTLSLSGPHKIEPTPRRVRALFSGSYIFDTTSASHVWEHKYFPQFWVPLTDVKGDLLKIGNEIEGAEGVSNAILSANGKETDRVLVFKKGVLAGLVRFEFSSLDAWFEEDAQIYDHPKSPYTRIDILPSSRKITVEIGGVKVAECGNPMFLFETGLRPRYYLPKTSVQWQYLSPSTTTTKCPYKGLAKYYNVTVEGKEYKDVIWWYEYPTTESAAIQGLVCFYNEKVDVFVEGVLEKK